MAWPPSPRPLRPGVLLLLLLLLPPLLLRAEDTLSTQRRFMNNCIQARRKCQANPTCSAAYHNLLDSCIYSASTPPPSREPEECQRAAQQLQNSSLMGCSCHRRMKNQSACLDIFWTVHTARSLGDYELDVSPYEDAVTSKPWKMNVSKLSMLKPDVEGKPRLDSNLCLKLAMLCTLNEKCERLRKAYGEACSGSRCQRPECRRQLRAFFEKAPEPLAQALLLCPCAPGDRSCGERRRHTIAPACALPSAVPNCLQLRHTCLAEPLCRSRLADFQTHCHPLHAMKSCPTEQSRCLRAYTGLIGTAMTPNFVSSINTSVALSCTCRGSGNLQEECERQERSFSRNPCLSEAIAAKMQFHRQLFQQQSDSSFSVLEHQNENPAQRPQPRMFSLVSCTLTLTLLLRLW
ncbi:GDNF family receptor alpha-3 [Tenrec ecaudatus]|uniref:GDNF family receptor alpha-3 n=1 Tax=Tenrec ecaudatus TaxID=94439 RepID=UPI003F5ABDD8